CAGPLSISRKRTFADTTVPLLFESIRKAGLMRYPPESCIQTLSVVSYESLGKSRRNLGDIISARTPRVPVSGSKPDLDSPGEDFEARSSPLRFRRLHSLR